MSTLELLCLMSRVPDDAILAKIINLKIAQHFLRLGAATEFQPAQPENLSPLEQLPVSMEFYTTCVSFEQLQVGMKLCSHEHSLATCYLYYL